MGNVSLKVCEKSLNFLFIKRVRTLFPIAGLKFSFVLLKSFPKENVIVFVFTESNKLFENDQL